MRTTKPTSDRRRPEAASAAGSAARLEGGCRTLMHPGNPRMSDDVRGFSMSPGECLPKGGEGFFDAQVS